MKQSVAKLVSVILARISEEPGEPHSESGIRLWLSRQGYNQRDIDAAMKLVRPRFAHSAGAPPHRPVPVRPLSLSEQQKLSQDARDALARLDMYELIDPIERELLLDRLNHFEGEVGLDELEYLVWWLLTATRDLDYQQTVRQIVDGQGATLH